MAVFGVLQLTTFRDKRSAKSHKLGEANGILEQNSALSIQFGPLFPY
jgi:hypothetical protein